MWQRKSAKRKSAKLELTVGPPGGIMTKEMKAKWPANEVDQNLVKVHLPLVLD